MSSLGDLLSRWDKRTVVFPLPVAPMTLLGGWAVGRSQLTRSEVEDI